MSDPDIGLDIEAAPVLNAAEQPDRDEHDEEPERYPQGDEPYDDVGDDHGVEDGSAATPS